ncbi:MAG: beta-ketoacyl-ACP synthase II [Bacteroidia bacterium]
MNHMKRVVITGMGALTPLGNTLETFRENLFAGTSGAAPITHFDAAKFKTQFACELKDFHPENFIEKSQLRKMDPVTWYAIAASDEALIHAGLKENDQINKDRVGVIWASGNGGLYTLQEQISEFAKSDGTPRFNPFFIPKTLIDITSGQLSMRYGFRGINYTTVSACASATSAIMDAFNYIRWGKADIILTGGSEAPICEAGIGGFNALKALSTRNDDPLSASRPYDSGRDGFVMGEGSGALVLESLEHAVSRGATIFAEIIGAGMSADAYHLTAVHPEGTGAKLAMRMALEDAGINPSDIDYINTHGTSTPNGDVSELRAIADVFGDHVNKMNVSSTKSMIGHLLGAAGAVEAIVSVLAVMHDTVPPTINLQNPDPEIPEGFNLTPNKAQQRTVNIAMSNTFGFGGHNAIAIFRKWKE